MCDTLFACMSDALFAGKGRKCCVALQSCITCIPSVTPATSPSAVATSPVATFGAPQLHCERERRRRAHGAIYTGPHALVIMQASTLPGPRFRPDF